MKHLKKLASILLVLVTVLSVTTTAFAAGVTNETAHSYNAYQISPARRRTALFLWAM